MKAVTAKQFLQHSAIVGHVLEEDDPVFLGLADPIEFLLPIRRSRDHPGENVVASRLGDEDAHLVALLGEAKVHRGHVAGVTDGEKPHLVPEVEQLSTSFSSAYGSTTEQGRGWRRGSTRF